MRSVNPFPENSTTTVKYEFRKYLAHDWLSWVAHFDPPSPRSRPSIAMNPDNQPDRLRLALQNTRLSKQVAATTTAHIADPKWLSKIVNLYNSEEFTKEISEHLPELLADLNIERQQLLSGLTLCLDYRTQWFRPNCATLTTVPVYCM